MQMRHYIQGGKKVCFLQKIKLSWMWRHDFSGYWTSTETYEALKAYMDMDFDGAGRILYRCRAAVMRVLKASKKLLTDTLAGEGAKVAEGLDKAHGEVASILTYNDENSQSLPNELFGKDLGAAIGLAYYSARKDYMFIREFPAGKGFADVVFLPLPSAGKPALVVELKYDKTADTAIRQIKDRKYPQALEGYVGEILLVGINYDRDDKNKPHSCVIERVEKGRS